MKKMLICLVLLTGGCWACTEDKRAKLPPLSIPAGMQYIPGGIYHKTVEHTNNSHEVEIEGFLLEKHPVTVAEFRRFVAATNYITDAEEFGDAGIFDLEKQQWALVKGAYWEYPLGREKPMAEDNHPVTQVSWNDAIKYCQWAAKRLPTALEWEYAARSNGQTETRYSWGNSLSEQGELKANVWQGKFPDENTGEDGYLYTAPVGIFGKTGHGLSDMGGNVWQWTADNSPVGGAVQDGEKLLKGGSFMCDAEFCHNYQVEGKTTSSPETALFHTGFRCAKSL